jgi:hypothetical protein
MKVIEPIAPTTSGSFSRASVGRYLGDDGWVGSAGVDAPRYQGGALLLEAAATNLLLYSEDLRNTAEAGSSRPWLQFSDADTSVNAVSTTDPSGTTALVSKLSCATTGTVSRQVSQSFTVADNADVCFSCYVRAAEVSALVLQMRSKAGLYGQARFNVSLGQAVSSLALGTAPVSIGIQNLGGSWYRVWASCNLGAGGSTPLMVLNLASSAFGAYSGAVGDGLYLWGAQVELGTVPTTYVATTTATASRAADVFTPGLLTNVPEADYAAYSSATTYALGNRCIRTSTHRIYESLQASNLNHTPETNPAWWLDVGPTNAWAMFDTESGTGTSVATGPLRVTLAPGYVNAVAVLGAVGNTMSVAVTDGASSTVAFLGSAVLNNPAVYDWLTYLTAPFGEAQDVVFLNLPAFSNPYVTITITGTPASAKVAVVGQALELGDMRLGPRASILDFSRKETDAFGNTAFVRRKFSKRLSIPLSIANENISAIFSAVGRLRAIPCVWVGAPGNIASSIANLVETSPGVWAATPLAALDLLTVFGFYRDFSITIPYKTYSECALELEGLT